jgi:hypothetical protein
MLERVQNQIIPDACKSRLAQRLARVVWVISNRVDALDRRVEELESKAGLLKNATGLPTAARRRKTNRRHPGYSAMACSRSAADLGIDLNADGRHCQDLLRRTKAVLRCCLAAL